MSRLEKSFYQKSKDGIVCVKIDNLDTRIAVVRVKYFGEKVKYRCFWYLSQYTDGTFNWKESGSFFLSLHSFVWKLSWPGLSVKTIFTKQMSTQICAHTSVFTTNRKVRDVFNCQ